RNKEIEAGLASGHQGRGNTLTFLPDGRTLLSGGSDYTVRFWETASGNEIRCITQPWPPRTVPLDRGLVPIALSPHCQFSASLAGADFKDGGSIAIRDQATGKELHVIPEQKPLRQPVFSPDGKILAVGDWRGREKVILWDTATWQEHTPCKATGQVAFS